jgi:HMG (high mobility group) box
MAEKRVAATRQAEGGSKGKGNVEKGKPKADTDDDGESSIASDATEPRSFEAMAKALGSRWRHLAPEKKQRFTDMATKDQQRYRREMEVYKEKLVAETVLGAAYLKKQRLQQEQAAAATQQGEDGIASRGGEGGNPQGEESGSATNAQVPSQIGIPAASSVFASPSEGASPAAAPLSSDIAQQIMFLQQQQQQQILLSPLGQAPQLTSQDLWLQQQHLQAQQQHLQSEQMILDAAMATAQRSSQFQAQHLGSHHNPFDAAARFSNPLAQSPQISVELQQTLWRLQQQQKAQESNQLHSILSQLQQQARASQNLVVRRCVDAPPPIMGSYLTPQYDSILQQNLLNDYSLGGQLMHQNASAALSQLQQQQLSAGSSGLGSLSLGLASFPSATDSSTGITTTLTPTTGGGDDNVGSTSGLTREQMEIVRSYQQQQQQQSPQSSEQPERRE